MICVLAFAAATASAAGRFGSALTTVTANFQAAAVFPPVDSSLPSITGTVQQGQPLSATTGTWTRTPTSYTYQWQDCDASGASCTNIAGATATGYDPVSADVGGTLRVVVTATNAGGSASATSPASSIVGIAAPANLGLPVVSGTAQQGQALSASAGAWANSPTGYTYQWQDCDQSGNNCANVAGATASSYTPAVSDVAHTLVVVVSATNATGTTSAASVATGLAAGVFTEFTGLAAGGVPGYLGTGLDGNVWFSDTGGSTHAVGRITPTGVITEYTAGLNPVAYPLGIVAGPDGNMWFADNSATTPAIGKINPSTGAITEYSAGLNSGARLGRITLGGNGNLWFTDDGTTPAIGTINPYTDAITEYSTGLQAGAFIYGIAAGPDGNVWFDDNGPTPAVGRITPAGVITEFTAGLPAGSAPGNQITAGPDGNLWFVDQGTTPAIGKITTSGVITEYSTGLNAGANPNSIATASDGNLWFGDNGTIKAIGTITPAGVITEYTGGLNASARPGGTGIAAGPDGNIWVADRGSSEGLIRFSLGGPVNTGLPTVSGSAVQGQALSVTAGGWSGTPVPAVGYQWQDCDQSGNNCANVAGATSSSYVLGAGDLRDTVRVIVTATNSLGYAPVALAQSAVVTGGPVNAALPVVSGAVQQGQAVSVSNGTWTGYPTPAYTYQWQDCNATGTGCSNITGATASSYTPAATDVAHTLIAIVTATNASGTVSTASAATGLVVGLISEFSSGLNAGGVPYAVTPGADGNVWFTDDSSATPAIGRITPTGVITEYSTGLNAGSKPLQGIVIGPDGNVWFTDNGTTPAIGKLNPSTGAITEYSSGLISGSSPRFITVGADGNLWFGDYGGAIGRITTAGVITEYTAGLNTGSHPQGITAGPDGNLWFTDNLAGAIGKITTAGVITEYSVTAGLRGITSGPDGNLWFTDSTGAIGRITTAGVVTKFSTGLNSGARPFYITPGADGNLWFQDSNPAGIGFGRITTTGVITEYTSGLPAGLNPYEITAGPDGNIWFADEGTTKAIGRIAIGGPVNTAQPTVSGTTQQGQTLTATTGTWTGYPAPTLTYQWQDCNTSGQNCTNITGATTNTYTPGVSDVAHTLVGVVTATNASGTVSTASTATGLVVGPINEFSSGLNAGSLPYGLVAGSDGNVWFADQGTTRAIGRITPTGVITEFSTGLNTGAKPTAITLGPDGDLWFSDGGTTKAIGKLNPLTGAITEYSTGLNAGSKPGQLTVGADGNLWFSDTGSTRAIGRITTAGVITEYSTGLNAGANPLFIAGGPDGNVWFADNGTTKAIGKITPAGVISEYSSGLTSSSNPYGIAAGPDGNVWFTDESATAPAIGEINPSTGTITEYGVAGSAPNGITAGSDGALWFGDVGNKAIGRITTSGVVSEFSAGLPAGNTTSRVAAGPDGNLWFTDNTTPAIGRLALGGPVNASVPSVSGTATQGQPLSATAGAWTGTPAPAVSYQWQDCDQSGNNCANIAGATSNSHVLGAGDLGGTVRVIVTATNSLGYAPVALAQSAVVTGGPANTALPVVSGTVQQGQAVSVSNGTWTGYPTPTYTYQWQDCNATGTSCSNITGATASSYTPAATDVAHTLVAIVTATNASGTVSTASAATGLVVGLINDFSTGLNAGASPYPPALGPDGSEWFGDGGTTPAVGRVSAAGVITEFSTGLNSGAIPKRLVAGSDGNMWFSDIGTTKAIGRITASGTITEYSSGLNAGALPNLVVQGADGSVWFNDLGTTAAIGKVTTSGAITEYSAGLNAGAILGPPVLGSDGNMWFVDDGTTKAVGKITPAGVITEYSSGLNAGASPAEMVLGPDGSMWFYDAGTTKAIGKVTPAGVITEYSAGLNAGGYPYAVAPGPDGAVWFVDNGTTKAIGKITPTGVITEYTAGLNAGSQPDYIWAGSDGSLWFDDQGTTKAIGRITTAGAITEYTAGLAAGSVPVLNVESPLGPDGNLWLRDIGTTKAIVRVAIGGPVDAAAPTISGTAAQGQTLTAAPGSWSGTPAPTLSYQWQDCDQSGNSCANIAGATSSSYVLAQSDGASTVRVVVKGSNTLGYSIASSAATAVVAFAAPTNTAVPTISGTAQQGQSLSTTSGAWTGGGIAFSYQWMDCNSSGASCANISGATASSYTPVAGDVGSTIRATVTATNTGGAVSATSAQTSAVLIPAPVNTGLPVVSGTVQQGQTLTTTTGTWNGAPSGYAYQWQDCNSTGTSCANIGGATASSYTVAASDIAATLGVVVTASNAGGGTAAASASTGTAVGAIGEFSTGLVANAYPLWWTAGADRSEVVHRRPGRRSWEGLRERHDHRVFGWTEHGVKPAPDDARLGWQHLVLRSRHDEGDRKGHAGWRDHRVHDRVQRGRVAQQPDSGPGRERLVLR